MLEERIPKKCQGLGWNNAVSMQLPEDIASIYPLIARGIAL
jgi:hypothetical protein